MRLGRNDPCSCGSGKKYKKCCIFSEHLRISNRQAVNLSASQDDLIDDEDFYDDDVDDDDLDLANILDDDFEEEFADLLLQGLTNLRMHSLERLPHIKEYNRIRQMHQEVVNSMMDYHYDGKFEHKIAKDYVPTPDEPGEVHLLEASFDTDTREGAHALADMLIYKSMPNMNCITEEYINKKRYKKPDKVEFLHAMLNSRLGLFETIKKESGTGYVYLREAISGDEIKITDIAHSGTPNSENVYLYTRIITYNGISFNTGLSLAFSKDDPFIKDYIREHKKDPAKFGEFHRFIQLYNRYSGQTNRVKVVPNKLGKN